MSRRTARRRQAAPFLAVCLGLAACLGPQEIEQPLSPMVVRGALAGRTIVADEDGQHTTLRFAPNGLASRTSSGDAEFGRWWIDATGALCLRWHDEPVRCAPVHAAHGSHYRWGDTTLSVLGTRR